MRHEARSAVPWDVWLWAAACWLALLALVRSYVWANVPLDDAYITFRYADHLVQGKGLVFNVGERVEGYTSLSWTLWIALLRALGVAPEDGARVSGVLLAGATLAVVASFPLSRAARYWALGGLASLLPFAFHAVNGLETGLMALLLTALLRSAPQSHAARRRALVLVALLVLTRPEGVFAVPVLIASDALCRHDALTRPVRVAMIVAAVTTFALHTLARFVIYGDWVANSARAKLLPLDHALPRGLADVPPFVWNTSAGVLIVGTVVALVVAFRRTSPEAMWTRRAACFSVIMLLLLARGGGDAFPLFRFFVPLAPALCLVNAQGLSWGFEWASRGVRWRRLVVQGLAVAIGVLGRVAVHPVQARALHSGFEAHCRRVGRALRDHAPPEATLALSAAGVIPYVTGLHTVDLLGLTEPTIARAAPDLSYDQPGHQRHDGKHVLDREPDLILLGNGPIVRRPDAPLDWVNVRIYERDIVADPRFAERYRLQHVPLAEGGFVQVFVREGVELRRNARTSGVEPPR